MPVSLPNHSLHVILYFCRIYNLHLHVHDRCFLLPRMRSQGTRIRILFTRQSHDTAPCVASALSVILPLGSSIPIFTSRLVLLVLVLLFNTDCSRIFFCVTNHTNKNVCDLSDMVVVKYTRAYLYRATRAL